MKNIMTKITKITMIMTMLFSQLCSITTVFASDPATIDLYETENNTVKIKLSDNFEQTDEYNIQMTQTFKYKDGDVGATSNTCSNAQFNGDITTYECAIDTLNNQYNGTYEFSVSVSDGNNTYTDTYTKNIEDNNSGLAYTLTDNENGNYDVNLFVLNADLNPTKTYTYEYTKNNTVLGSDLTYTDTLSYTNLGIYINNYNVSIKDNGVEVANYPLSVTINYGNVDELLNTDNTTGISFVPVNEVKTALFAYQYETQIPSINTVKSYIESKGYTVEVLNEGQEVVDGLIQNGQIINLKINNEIVSSYIVSLVYNEPVTEPIKDVSVSEIVETAATPVVNTTTTTNNVEETTVVTTDDKTTTETKSSKKKATKEETTDKKASNITKVIVIVLIVVVLAGLVYLIFRDEEQVGKNNKKKTLNKKQPKKKK